MIGANALLQLLKETIRQDFFSRQFIFMPENPRLLSLGMNGTRSEAKASHLYGMKPRPLGRGVFILFQKYPIELMNQK